MEETKVPEELEEDLDDAVELEERPPIKTKEDRAVLIDPWGAEVDFMVSQ